jgi:hypothetical protein
MDCRLAHLNPSYFCTIVLNIKDPSIINKNIFISRRYAKEKKKNKEK